MRDFHQNAKLVRGLNSSFIALIPKNENPASLNEYRPISLVGSMYKILAKVLSNRLKQVLPRIISETQSAFLRGRNILDGILIANEIVDGWKKARGCGVVLKLDFHKAYDSVNWEFLFSMLVKFGFGTKWVRWMKVCVTSVRSSVLVNGSPTTEFSPQKGLRQGDPLSPFLLIIVAEALNILMGRAKDLGLITGASIGPSSLRITHLQFADDTILFCEADWGEIVNIKRILRCFEVLSGLRINFNKSVVCGVGIPEELGQDFASRLNCKFQKLPIKYLGLPLGASPSSSRTWLPVIEKCKQRLASWKRRYLSFAGRLTLIKSVLASLPIFYLSIFKMPEMVAKKMESIQSAFLWGGSDLRRKVHLVKWEDVSKSKNLGGLGVKRIRIMNVCLLLKWWWRFGAEENSLWKDVICRKYRETGWYPSTERTSRLSKTWADIIYTVASRADLMQFFRSNAVVKLGDGRRIRFWSDCWIEGVCLRDEFPRLYSLSVDKEESVFMFHSNRDVYGNWVFNFRRSLFAWEEAELSRLLVLLSRPPLLRANVADCLTWNANTAGCFSVSSVYQWFELGFGANSLIYTVLWKAPAPPRAQFFGWLVWKGRIKSASYLRRIGILNANVDVCYVFCKEEEETINHVLLHCPRVWLIWSYFVRRWGWQWASPGSVQSVIQWWSGCSMTKLEKKLWSVIPYAIFWSIWKQRNDSVFNGVEPNFLALCESIEVRIALWIKSYVPALNFTVNDLLWWGKAEEVSIAGVMKWSVLVDLCGRKNSMLCSECSMAGVQLEFLLLMESAFWGCAVVIYWCFEFWYAMDEFWSAIVGRLKAKGSWAVLFGKPISVMGLISFSVLVFGLLYGCYYQFAFLAPRLTLAGILQFNSISGLDCAEEEDSKLVCCW
ncbi:uncharacterized protein LOC114312000 [Camellia sinensis]|uniref:uncharacterized protein LOC114312000 n=1 Tax=Camellia sinensis TaxID=4442 RepID=UPI001035682C|nr:uncharacterized protein LOC114312000 [Camellia sinensis]